MHKPNQFDGLIRRVESPSRFSIARDEEREGKNDSDESDEMENEKEKKIHTHAIE